jgi:hypothetical protein
VNARGQQIQEFHRLVFEWHQHVNYVKEQETRLIVVPEKPTQQNLEAHKRCLKKLLQAGRVLVSAIEQLEIELPSPYETEHLKAIVSRVGLDLRLWHEEDKFSMAESDAFIDEVFA